MSVVDFGPRIADCGLRRTSPDREGGEAKFTETALWPSRVDEANPKSEIRNPKSILLLAIAIVATTSGASANDLPDGRDIAFGQDVTIEPKPNEQVPADLEFRDEHGNTVRLGDYYGEKPILLQLVYLRCPMLCGAQLDGLSRTLTALEMTAGEEFTVLTVSFDPDEPPALAAKKRENYLKRYNRPAAEDGWHFLTGKPSSINALTNAVGFRYVRDEETGQYAHAAGLMVLTPEGRVARYLFGVDYGTRDVRLAVVEASQGEIATVTDQVLLYCYLYDATTGKYGLAILNLLRAGGLLTVGLMFGSIFWMSYRTPSRALDPPTETSDSETVDAVEAGASDEGSREGDARAR